MAKDRQMCSVSEHPQVHENLYANVHSSFLGSKPKPETNKMSCNGWMVKQIVVYPYHEILPSNKKKQVVDNIQQCRWISNT